MSEGANSDGIGSFLTNVFSKVGFYWTLAAVIVVLAAWKFPDVLREFRKCLVTIALFRQTKPVVNASLEERKESIEARIDAVRAIEDNSPLPENDNEIQP